MIGTTTEKHACSQSVFLSQAPKADLEGREMQEEGKCQDEAMMGSILMTRKGKTSSILLLFLPEAPVSAASERVFVDEELILLQLRPT